MNNFIPQSDHKSIINALLTLFLLFNPYWLSIYNDLLTAIKSVKDSLLT